MVNRTVQRLVGYIYQLRQSYLRSYISHNELLGFAVLIWGVFSVTASYYIRFDFDVPPQFIDPMPYIILAVALLKLLMFFALGAHKSNWRYVGISEIRLLLWASILSSLVIFALSNVYKPIYVPRGVIIIDCILFFLGSCAIRLAGRMVREKVFHVRGRQKNVLRPAIIIGAGDAGEMLLREIRRNPAATYSVKAYFDDNPAKHGQYIHGVKIVGSASEIVDYFANNNVEVALIAIPSADRQQMNNFYNILRPLNIDIKTLPPVLETIEGEALTARLRDIDITDLLGREQIKVDRSRIHELLRDRTVLVTGAGGSIGSEISRQVCASSPKQLLLLDKSENLLFHIHRKLESVDKVDSTTKVTPLLCDLRDRNSVEEIMSRFRPEIVLHAAAHKHVFMQELNPAECFRNNVGGLRNIVEFSHKFMVDKFVLISTDKAVNPTSVMGATKRLCELYCQAYAQKSETSFLSVRFGNVLGSDGSVVPIFLEQINMGGPVTITHPDAKRYFMTIPEAVSLVLESTVIGETGQILMLDMGEPIRILDLARELIRITGKSEFQIPIEYIGLKPGEKLFEKLSCDSESCVLTGHPKINLYRSEPNHDSEEFVATVDAWLERFYIDGMDLDVRGVIRGLVKEYTPSEIRQYPDARVVGNNPYGGREIARKDVRSKVGSGNA